MPKNKLAIIKKMMGMSNKNMGMSLANMSMATSAAGLGESQVLKDVDGDVSDIYLSDIEV